MGKEILDQGIELILFEYRHRMTRVGHDPQIRLRDVLRDEDRVEDRDGIMVTADDKRGAGNVMQLVQGNMGLIKIQVRDLELSFDLGC